MLFRSQINQTASDGSLVDFAAMQAAGTGFEVQVGPQVGLTLEMDAAEGAVLKAAGHLELDVFGLLQVAGDFALHKKTGQITLAGETTPLDVDLLTLGASGVDAFVGVNGGADNALGLQVLDLEFGLALISERTGALRSWTSLQGSAGFAGLVGVNGLSLSASDLAVAVNREAADDSVVDYQAQPLEIATGPNSSLTLDMAGAEIGRAHV